MKENVVDLGKQRASRELDERTDDELMLLASSGRRDAFAALVRRHAVRVVRLLGRAAGETASAEELAQDVWLAVWNHRESYRAEGTFGRWLVTLTLNRARNAKRDGTRRSSVVRAADDSGEIARVPDTSPEELDRLIREERARRVQRSLDALKEPLREAVVLRFTEGFAYEEIARVLEVNESTARSRVFHGLKELKRRLHGVEP